MENEYWLMGLICLIGVMVCLLVAPWIQALIVSWHGLCMTA